MKRAILNNKQFVLWLTFNQERIEFDDLHSLELAKKQEENEGNGFRCWVEVEHNDELLIIGLD